MPKILGRKAHPRINIRLSHEVKDWLNLRPEGARVWIEALIKKCMFEESKGIFVSPRDAPNTMTSKILSVRLHPDLTAWVRIVGARELIEERVTMEIIRKRKNNREVS